MNIDTMDIYEKAGRGMVIEKFEKLFKKVSLMSDIPITAKNYNNSDNKIIYILIFSIIIIIIFFLMIIFFMFIYFKEYTKNLQQYTYFPPNNHAKLQEKQNIIYYLPQQIENQNALTSIPVPIQMANSTQMIEHIEDNNNKKSTQIIEHFEDENENINSEKSTETSEYNNNYNNKNLTRNNIKFLPYNNYYSRNM